MRLLISEEWSHSFSDFRFVRRFVFQNHFKCLWCLHLPNKGKNVWRYLLWWPHVYVFAKLNGRCAFETPPSSLFVILSLNTIAKRFEWILITFFRSIDWGHVNNPLFSHCYVYQGLQFNDLLVKINKKNPYNLETMILTSVCCIVNI